MAQCGEVARPAAVGKELVQKPGVAGAAQNGEVHIDTGTFDDKFGVAAARLDGPFYEFRGFQLGAMYDNSGNFAPQLRPGSGRGEEHIGVLSGAPAAVFDTSGNFAPLLRSGAGSGEEHVGVLLEDPGAGFYTSGKFARQDTGRGEDLLGVLPKDPGAGFYTSGNFTRQDTGCGEDLLGVLGNFAHQASPDAGRATELRGVLLNNPGAVLDSSGNFKRQASPEAGRATGLRGVLLNKPGAVFDSSGDFARQASPDAGRALRIVGALRDSNLGAAYDSSCAVLGHNLGTVVGNSGTLAEHLRRLLPVAGIVASSAALTGLADSMASLAAGFGFFVLLLGGLSLVMIHVLRA